MRVGMAVAAAGCMVASLGASGAEAPGIVTLLEGPAALLRGTTRYEVAEGVRLQSGDIIELGDDALAQIEFADGVLLSLGPRSRFYAAALASRAAKTVGISDLYLLQGWTKFAIGKAGTPFRLTTPHFGVAAASAVAVAQVERAEASVFVESGDLRLAEGFTKAGPTSPVHLQSGQFYARKANQKGELQARPAATFVAAMPKPYFDNLPVRIAKHQDTEAAPRRLTELEYADVEFWLKSPREIRRSIMPRFVAKADDPAFRHAVIANMRHHPEWDRVLFPEKYLPKPPPQSPGSIPAPAKTVAPTPAPPR